MTLKAALAGALCLLTAACGAPEPTAEQKAAAEQAAVAEAKKQLQSAAAAFPQKVEAEYLPAVASISVSNVADMQGAADTIKSLERIGSVAQQMKRADESRDIATTPQFQSALKRLENALMSKQGLIFPAARQTFARFMSGEVEGLQTNFRAVGPGGKTLRAASPSFDSEEVVTRANQALMLNATRFRFTKAEYVYALDGSSYTFELRGESDREIGF